MAGERGTVGFIVRQVIAQRDGLQFRAGDVFQVVSRTGYDEVVREVLAEMLAEDSPLTAADFILDPARADLLPGLMLCVTAEENDPLLWEELRGLGWVAP